MITQTELTNYLSEYLDTETFKDMCPNGLQVSGTETIERVVTGVSASVELFERAADKQADAIIVHHGLIWDFNRPIFKGGHRERLRILLQKNMNLYAFHLPLDAHPEIGNNAVIAKELNLHNIQPFGDYKGQTIGMQGEIDSAAFETFFSLVEQVIETKPIIFAYGPKKINRIGVMSGGAQKEITQAVQSGLDVYLTGEISEHIMHYAKEEKIHFIAAGHYATERFGIRALGRHLAERFNLDVSFVDLPNPA